MGEEQTILRAGGDDGACSYQVVFSYADTLQAFFKTHFRGNLQPEVLGLCKGIQEFVVEAGDAVLVGMVADGVILRYRT